MVHDQAPSLDGVYEPLEIAVLREALQMASADCDAGDGLDEAVRRRMARLIIAAADAGFRESSKLARIAVDGVKVDSIRRGL